jgi:translation initiation factor IF-2
MKIKIDLDSFGKEMNSMIAEQLDELKYPVCLGTQSPIILENIMDVDSDDYIDVKFNVPEAQRSKVNMEEFTDNPIFSNNFQYVLPKECENSLEETKKQITKKHVKKLIQCMECRLFEKCSSISTNYLLSIIVKNTMK